MATYTIDDRVEGRNVQGRFLELSAAKAFVVRVCQTYSDTPVFILSDSGIVSLRRWGLWWDIEKEQEEE